MNIQHFLTGPIRVNTYLAYDDTKKGFIVDPGGYSPALAQWITGDGIDIEYIILTHGHADHIGGVLEFKERFPQAKVLAHASESTLLQDPEANLSAKLYKKPMIIEADIYVENEETITVGHTTLTFLHTPGHTAGGMCILIPGSVFCGDTLFQNTSGAVQLAGGNEEELSQSIKSKLFVLPEETRVLPGHMKETTIGYAKKHCVLSK